MAKVVVIIGIVDIIGGSMRFEKIFTTKASYIILSTCLYYLFVGS